MTEETKINLLLKLEEQARATQNKMDKIESRWQKLKEKLSEKPEWDVHCEKNGIMKNYRFCDVLV